MGGKPTKQPVKSPKKEKNEIPKGPMVNIRDDSLFPSGIQEELQKILLDFPMEKQFFIKRFERSSTFMRWIENLDYEDPFFHALDEICSTPEEGIHTYYKYISTALQAMCDYFLVVFVPSGHIVGFSIVGKDTDRPNTLKRYMTCAGPKRIGIGKALVKEIHTLAAEMGLTAVRLASSTQSSTRYHTQHGYALTGEKIAREGNEMIFNLPKQNTTNTRRKKKKNNN